MCAVCARASAVVCTIADLKNNGSIFLKMTGGNKIGKNFDACGVCGSAATEIDKTYSSGNKRYGVAACIVHTRTIFVPCVWNLNEN